MNKLLLSTLVLTTACASQPPPQACPPVTAPGAPAPAAPSTALAGSWHGVLGGELRLQVALRHENGRWVGTLDSLDQGATLPLTKIEATERSLRFSLEGVEASFEGTLDAAGVLQGSWTQNAKQPLSLARGDAPPKPPISAPLDVHALSNPIPAQVDGKNVLVYELEIDNYSRRALTLESVEIEAAGKPAYRIEGAALNEACDQNKGAVSIAGGGRVVVYVWLPYEGSAPRSLDHRLVVAMGDIKMTVDKLPVAVKPAKPLVVGAPLRGGTWLAGNGPSRTSNHRHALVPVAGRVQIAQRFAIDWVKVDDKGKTFHDDGQKNANFYAYGADALAVASGVVVAVKDGIEENTPHKTRKDVTLDNVGGNHVVVDLGGGAFAFWAHLQPGSLRVKVGDRVKRGQVLGLVGNSGNSTEPHLHFHVSDAAAPLAAQGIPYAFERYELLTDKAPSPRLKHLPSEDQRIVFPQ